MPSSDEFSPLVGTPAHPGAMHVVERTTARTGWEAITFWRVAEWNA